MQNNNDMSEKDQITDTTTEKVVTQHDNATVKQHRRVTAKEKGYVAAIAEGKTKRDAVRTAYNVNPLASVKTLDKMAANIEKRPVVLALLNKHEEEAQESVLDVMRYSRDWGKSGTKDGAQYARVALDGANSLLDRVHGKAKQSVEVTSTAVNLNIDLSN